MTADEAAALDDAVLVDVRETDEWRAGHAPSAQHIPLGRLANHAPKLPKNRRIICICRSGNRSAQATLTLRDAGLDAVNLEGGMRAWAAAGLPVVDDRRRPGSVI
jgi:rhodanese-related sulfurtransferase